METGAPAKWIVDPLLIIYHGLVIPFAIGLHRGVKRSRKSFLAPALLASAEMIAGLGGELFALCLADLAPGGIDQAAARTRFRPSDFAR